MALTRSVLSCLSCRKFRTYFLLVLALIFVSQSLIFYYMLYNVGEAESPVLHSISSVHTTTSRASSKERDAGYMGKFPCDIVSKTAISAIRRASTQICKQELSEVACQLKNRQLFPSSLPNYCLREDARPGISIGCFQDSDQQRLLSGYGARLQDLTVQKCINICTQSAFPYAGVRSGKECYCGSEKPSSEYLLTPSYCTVPCEGHSSQYCGGMELTEVFDTGVPLRESSKLQEPVANGSVNIAFILTLNGRSLRQVTRLLRVLYRPHHTYFIHVDARQDYLFRNLLFLERKYVNIRLTRQRQSTIWGGVSLLDVLLKAMTELLGMNRQWDFVFNLSESDLTLKPVEELENLLAANGGRNFLKSHGRQARQFIHKQGLDRVFHQCESRMWRVGDRNLPGGIRFDGGSDWFGLSRQFVEYAVNGNDPLVKGLKHLFHYTLLPAESFFHVLVLNSKFCRTYADNNLRMTLWRRSQGCLCQHRAVVDWCGCSPMVFRTSDWNQLSNAFGKSMIHFARKFESVIDQSVINKLEEVQLTNTSISYQGWDSYWDSVYHVGDVSPAPNKALLAVSNSLVHNALSKVKQDSTCILKPTRTVAVMSYFHRDHYKGDLILHDFLLNDEKHQLEILARPLSKTVFFTEFQYLSTLQVGSDYDPKEQVLRNRLGVMSQVSKPTASFKWNGYLNSSSSSVIQFIWFDPALNVRAVHEVNISNTSKISSQALDLDPPLAAGVWALVVVLGDTKLASTEFLIVPLVGDVPDAAVKTLPNQQHWQTYLNLNQSARTQRLDYSSLSTDRTAHLHSLLSHFFSVESICVVRQPSLCTSYIAWPICSQTVWSSLSPDPKSSLIV